MQQSSSRLGQGKLSILLGDIMLILLLKFENNSFFKVRVYCKYMLLVAVSRFLTIFHLRTAINITGTAVPTRFALEK
jgi:hypothetical protein